MDQAIEINPNKKFNVMVSYLQIYNEKVFDLLNPTSSTTDSGLRMRYSQKDQFVVENLFIFTCTTPAEVLALFTLGQKNKVTASHSMNINSSRSHTIFTVTVESIDKN